MKSRRGPLADPIFRRLFGAQVVALLGTGLLTVALGLLAVDVAPGRAGTVLGTALAIKMVAYVAVAPVMAAVVARMPPRRVLVGADVVRIAVAVSLPFVTEVWQVYLLVLVLQSASATFTPTFQAVIPTVLTDERDYTQALSWSRLAYDLESVVSPVVAAGLLFVMSFHGLFVGTALGFAGSAILVLSNRLPAAAHDAEGRFWSRATRGLHLFLRTRALRGLIALDLVVAATTSLVLVDTVVIVQEQWSRSQVDVALALATYGGGSMIVALFVPRIVERCPVRTVMVTGGLVSMITTGATIPVLSTDDAWWALLVTWAVLGAAASMILTPAARVLVQVVPEPDRPAAFAAHFSLSHGWFLLTYPLVGWVGAWLGLPILTTILAVMTAAALAAAGRLWPRQRSRSASLVG